MQGFSLSIRRMDAEALEFSADRFDYVFSWGVIHHSQRSAAIIAEIQRVLKARNAAVPAGRARECRIGVHVGEVRAEALAAARTSTRCAHEWRALRRPSVRA